MKLLKSHSILASLLMLTLSLPILLLNTSAQVAPNNDPANSHESEAISDNSLERSIDQGTKADATELQTIQVEPDKDVQSPISSIELQREQATSVHSENESSNPLHHVRHHWNHLPEATEEKLDVDESQIQPVAHAAERIELHKDFEQSVNQDLLQQTQALDPKLSVAPSSSAVPFDPLADLKFGPSRDPTKVKQWGNKTQNGPDRQDPHCAWRDGTLYCT